MPQAASTKQHNTSQNRIKTTHPTLFEDEELLYHQNFSGFKMKAFNLVRLGSHVWKNTHLSAGFTTNLLLLSGPRPFPKPSWEKKPRRSPATGHSWIAPLTRGSWILPIQTDPIPSRMNNRLVMDDLSFPHSIEKCTCMYLIYTWQYLTICLIWLPNGRQQVWPRISAPDICSAVLVSGQT